MRCKLQLTRDELEMLIHSCVAAASGYGGKPFAPHPSTSECEALDVLTDKLIDWKQDALGPVHSTGLTADDKSKEITCTVTITKTVPTNESGSGTTT